MSKGTVAIDSGSELARLAFSWDLKKSGGDYETIRAMGNYPGMTERLNMIARRLKDFRKAGFEVVVLNHESIDKIYARGSAMAKKSAGENTEPTALKGRIDIPGNTAPEEIMRAADNIFRVRLVNNTPMWVTKLEPIGPGAPEPWQVKDRFNATQLLGDYIEPSYAKIVERILAKKAEVYWHPPYIWMIYGAIGMRKTRSIASFPPPRRVFDIDCGTSVLAKEIADHPEEWNITQYNSEDKDDWPRFVIDFEATLGEPGAVEKAEKRLGLKK